MPEETHGCFALLSAQDRCKQRSCKWLQALQQARPADAYGSPWLQVLPLRKTLICHLLAAWTLKLPLWATDLNHAVTTGELPFLKFAALAEDAMQEPKLGALAQGVILAPGLLESPQLSSAAMLVNNAQAHAAEWALVIPELNLSALLDTGGAAMWWWWWWCLLSQCCSETGFTISSTFVCNSMA